MNTFKFIGQIEKLKDKQDRKSIETVEFDSGWMIERVKFRMNCGESSEYVDLSAGKFKEDSRNTIYTQFVKDGSENKKDVENVQVKWAERNDPAIIEKVPSYKKYIIDLSSDKIRKALIDAGKEEEAAELATKKYTFISQYDFVTKFEELLLSGAFNNGKYVVTGTIEYNYSLKKDEGKYFRSFVPTNIYKASDDEEPVCKGKVDFYYNKEEVVGEELESGEIPLYGYVQFYERMSKEYYFVKTTLLLDKLNEKRDGLVTMFNKMGDDEAEVLVIGANVSFFTGSVKTEINVDDLDEDQKEMLALGIYTKEDVIAEMGGSAYGDRKDYVYFEELARGYSRGPQKTDYSLEKLAEKPTGEKKQKGATKTQTKYDVDLFKDDEI